MTIKFKDSISAEACVLKMNGRFFDKRRVSDPHLPRPLCLHLIFMLELTNLDTSVNI